MNDLGKWLVIIGCAVALVGALVWLGAKVGIPFGRLPGDLSISREKFSFYFPIATSIAISIILTILINVVLYLFRR